MCRAVAKESEREKNARNYVAAQKEKKEKYEYINKGIFKTTKKKMYIVSLHAFTTKPNALSSFAAVHEQYYAKRHASSGNLDL